MPGGGEVAAAGGEGAGWGSWSYFLQRPLFSSGGRGGGRGSARRVSPVCLFLLRKVRPAGVGDRRPTCGAGKGDLKPLPA